MRRAQAHEELGRFFLAAEASVSAENGSREKDLEAELQEIRRRLEHARWRKMVGDGLVSTDA